MMKRKVKFTLSTTQVILLGFLGVILVGSGLLVLPFATKSGVSVGYLDALFTATTSTCVTGLVTLTTVDTWSVFGQIVILILIQIGGLGVITVSSCLLLLLHRKIGVKDSHLIQDAFNLNTLAELGKFVKKVVIGTLIIEALGALLYMTVFIPDFGTKGIWIAVFNSVSAFCNAGIDIVSADSLSAYACNPMANFVTCTLVVLGGLGYIVWWDVIRVMREWKTYKFKSFQRLTLHSKIVLTVTSVLIFGGALLFLLFEYNNPLTMGNYHFFDKLQMSFFQSVMTRTAGFSSVSQAGLTNGSAMLSILLMFIGGSPVGTAGGVKTVTVFVLFAMTLSTVTNKNETTVFHRTLSRQAIGKAMAVVGVFMSIVIISTLLLAVAMPEASALDLIYETVSATATVGLSRNLTASLNAWGKLVITGTMYLGRVGPISLLIAFRTKKEIPNIIKNPTEEISVG